MASTAPSVKRSADPPQFNPDHMPANPVDQEQALAYFRARGIRPRWADRVHADKLITRGEMIAIIARLAARIEHLERAARGRCA